MSKGYFVLAINTEDTDYIKMAYGLALSIKATQSKYANLSIGVRAIEDVPEEYIWAFDKIIPIPWDNSEKNGLLKKAISPILNDDEMKEFNDLIDRKFTEYSDDWRFVNEWKVFDMSPYDCTIKLEADMILTDDISHYWDILADVDLKIPNKVLNYKNEPANTEYYRQVFTQNDIYSAQSCFTYFRKSKVAKDFFEMVNHIFANWDEVSWDMIRKIHQSEPTTDVVYGLAVDFLDIGTDVQYADDEMTFVHMRSNALPFQTKYLNDEQWTKFITYGMTEDLDLFINGFKQTKPFHYHDKTFLTDEMIQKYEDYLNE